MTRLTIFDLIDKERKYQDTIRKEREQDDRPDSVKAPAEFLLFIEERLRRAKEAVYKLDDGSVQKEILKIATLAVAELETREGSAL